MPLSENKKAARRALPRMPEELFGLWFDQRIENNGWPPVDGNWPRLLGFVPFAQWQLLVWEERQVDLLQVNFTPHSSGVIGGIADSVFRGVHNAYFLGMGEESRRKVTNIHTFAGANRSLPSKLVFIRTTHGAELLDGYHRCAAFFECRREHGDRCIISSIANSWVGALPPNAAPR